MQVNLKMLKIAAYALIVQSLWHSVDHVKCRENISVAKTKRQLQFIGTPKITIYHLSNTQFIEWILHHVDTLV